MKKTVSLLLIIVMLLTCAGCGTSGPDPMELKISEMKAICELSVMECYYHNVAKYYEKEAEKGFLGIGNNDKHFWIEYSGIVKLGIDISLVNIEINGTEVNITIPEAKVLGCKVDSASLDENSFIVDKDSVKVRAQDEIRAFDEAQSQLEEAAANDRALLDNAQKLAMDLLEEYIHNIGAAAGKEYSINWIHLNADGTAVVDSAGIAEVVPIAE